MARLIQQENVNDHLMHVHCTMNHLQISRESRFVAFTIDLAENYSGELKSFTGESEHGMNDSRQLMY